MRRLFCLAVLLAASHAPAADPVGHKPPPVPPPDARWQRRVDDDVAKLTAKVAALEAKLAEPAACPGGVCPVPSAAPAAGSPGPGYTWRTLPGVGPGWVHSSVPEGGCAGGCVTCPAGTSCATAGACGAGGCGGAGAQPVTFQGAPAGAGGGCSGGSCGGGAGGRGGFFFRR